MSVCAQGAASVAQSYHLVNRRPHSGMMVIDCAYDHVPKRRAAWARDLAVLSAINIKHFM